MSTERSTVGTMELRLSLSGQDALRRPSIAVRGSRLRDAVRWDSLRMALARPAQVAAQGSGVLLLVAIQHFDAGSTAKAFLVGSVFIGLLASPIVINLVARCRLTASRGLALLLGLAGLAFAVAGLSPAFGGFLFGALVGVPLVSSATPLVTAIWRQNVPSMMRGRFFSQANGTAVAAGIASTFLIALYLGDDAGRFRPAIIVLALLLLAAALASLRTPSRSLGAHARNPLGVLALLWQHPLFGALSLSWFLVGIGNLSTLPLRTEYLASGDYGPAYSARVVLVVTAVLPQATALVTTLMWGRLFDRVRFPVLRLVLNMIFAASVVVFFGPSLMRQVVGSLLMGVAQGGGMVTWNLWVTKYAPPRRTADYMAVHTFLTGVRGLLAPLFAYRLLGLLPLLTVTWIGVGFNLSASLILVAILVAAVRSARDPGVATVRPR